MKHEQRSINHEVAELEIRSGENGATGLRGYAAVYSSLSELLGGSFREEIAPGAFSSILARKPDVRALVNHDESLILGRSKSGTLSLTHTSKGLLFDVPNLPNNTAGRDAAESIRRGDMSQCSFAFSKASDTWREEIVNGKPTAIRTLLDFELHDVSVVTYAAYPETEVNLRSALDSLKAWAGTQRRRGKSIQKSMLEILEKMS